jgi:DNA-binding CsgD family transcriptional regulator
LDGAVAIYERDTAEHSARKYVGRRSREILTKTATTKSSAEILHQDWGQLELPLLLVDLDDFLVRAVSEAAVRRIGVPLSALVGHPIVDQVRTEERASVVAALEAMSAGVIDFYRSQHTIGSARPRQALATEWVRAIEFGDERLALVEAAGDSELRQSPLAEHLGREPMAMAVGTIDTDGRVMCVSNDVTALLGISPDKLVGRLLSGLVGDSDVVMLHRAGRLAHREPSLSVNVELRDASGAWKPLRCVLTSLAGSTERCFILVDDHVPPSQGGGDRAAQLERHLRRIAAEVDASRVLQSVRNVPEPAHFAQLSALSARQREVLARLIRGERVRTIADGLFVSQSTVRNHLSAIFERFGVHSQAELLALLSGGGEVMASEGWTTRCDPAERRHRLLR